MSSSVVSTMPVKTSSTAESGGIVEISNVRRSFYSAGCAAPDLFFTWLLSAARDACKLGEYSQSDAAPPTLRKAANLMAETYMAGLLLCDENFIPASVQRSSDHHYSLDFVQNTIQLRTQLYMASKAAASYSTIRIRGSITEGAFEVRNVVTDRILARVTEDEIQKPEFFSQELPFLCFHAQKDSSITVDSDGDEFIEQGFEMKIEVKVAGEGRTVLVVKEKGKAQGEARDPESGRMICTIPLRHFRNIGLMIDSLPAMLLAGTVNSLSDAYHHATQ
jgi:hypothetical protein